MKILTYEDNISHHVNGLPQRKRDKSSKGFTDYFALKLLLISNVTLGPPA
jgi:hypothetical protein